MRILYVKSNVLRKREFAINTSIIEEDGKKVVIKKAVHSEGAEHLKQICANQELLKKTFPHVEINKAWLLQDVLYAEFIEGVSLTSFYSKAVKDRDKDAFLALFDWHLNLFSDESNICLFEQTEEFVKVFGDIGAIYTGEPALKVMNFDVLSDNILFRNGDIGKPAFIDFEWVFDFPVPISFLHFFIANALYRYINELEKIVEPKELIAHSKLYKPNIDYSVMWSNFSQYFRVENSLDLDRLNERFTKNSVSSAGKNSYIVELENSIAWHSNYLKEQQAYIEYQNTEINRLNGGILWHQQREKEQQAHIEYQNTEIDRLNGGILWHQRHEEEQQMVIEKLNQRIVNRLIRKIKEVVS